MNIFVIASNESVKYVHDLVEEKYRKNLALNIVSGRYSQSEIRLKWEFKRADLILVLIDAGFKDDPALMGELQYAKNAIMEEEKLFL